MNINEISKPVTVNSLNQNLAKLYGKRIDVDAFTLEQLQDARNKLRTKLSQIETTESFDAVHKDDGYQKSKLFLDILNREISEREDQLVEFSPENEKAADEEDIPQRGRKKKAEPKKKKSPFTKDIPATEDEIPTIKAPKGPYKRKATQADQDADQEHEHDDGTFHSHAGGKKPHKHDKVDESEQLDEGLPVIALGLVALALGAYGTISSIMDNAERTAAVAHDTKALKMAIAMGEDSFESKIWGMRVQIVNGEAVPPKGAKKAIESSEVTEGKEDEAELVMAAKDMVNRVTGWMEDTAEMQTESMLELADAIRDELGIEQSDSFVGTVKPALEALYDTMETTRTALTTGVGLLTGEGAPIAEPMGAEDEAPVGEPEMEPTVDQEAGDEFAAAEAAAGGAEEAGRAKRESIERSRRLGTILSSKKK